MSIRATILTPVLAVFTVVALIGTGIVLDQTRHEDASATALDSMPDFAVVAATAPAAMVDAGLSENIAPAVTGVQRTRAVARAVATRTPPVVPTTAENDEPSEPQQEEDYELDDEASEDD